MRKLLMVVLVVLMPLCAFADSEKEALAGEMMDMMQMDRMMTQMRVQVEQMIRQMNMQLNIPDHSKVDYEAFQKKVMAKAFEIMDIEGSKGEVKKLFADIYTLDEMQGIVEFYKSPVGQSLLDKQPQVMQKSFEMSQEKMKALIPELQKMAMEFNEKMNKE